MPVDGRRGKMLMRRAKGPRVHSVCDANRLNVAVALGRGCGDDAMESRALCKDLLVEVEIAILMEHLKWIRCETRGELPPQEAAHDE